MEELQKIEDNNDLTIIEKLEDEAKKRAVKHVAGMLRKQESLDKVGPLFLVNHKHALII